ncbi:hypothetical protein GCM10017764_02830 [Sphingobacterium griseoflavum]|uniref:Uncharacterized protein n=1 Tax=Sphingobacterium griseoflavum TaxID=1474952 RepID=A0ABQ3HSX5_9SPHI|nr:hypothetical protein GCM10017764_02830 [Sphingobacterium griseoflavum]
MHTVKMVKELVNITNNSFDQNRPSGKSSPTTKDGAKAISKTKIYIVNTVFFNKMKALKIR